MDTDSAAIRRLEQVPQPRGHLSVHATWSPDGKRLLIDRRSDEFATTGFIRDMATGEERQAKLPEAGSSARTRADGTFVSPYESRWSADGKSFVFLISLKTDFETRSSTSRVSVANVHTGDVTSQIDLPVSRSMYSFPTVAPDSRHLYTAKGDLNGSGVVRIDLQTGEEKQVCVARGMAWALSPDGSQIACAGFGNTIQILPAQGGRVRDLVKGDEFGPMTWTADGKHLIYTTLTPSAASGGSGHYWIVPVTGGTPRSLDIGLGSAGSMSVHPDNRHIAISPEGIVATEL